jgi:pilus assembly protein CpaB
MKPRTIILLVVAIVCGLAAMYMTNRLLADKATQAPVNNVKVLVSKQKIAAWTPIRKPEEMFEVKEVPEGTYSSKCITDLKDLKDQALKQPLGEQMPITKDDLATEATAGLIMQLKEGQRATAIKVTPESLAGGFVLPGSRVDVMWIKKRGDTDSQAQIVLQDMLVLAVDMKNTRDDGQTSMLGSTATLATTPEEAEGLALASSLGDLRLLLRTPLDQGQRKYKPVTIEGIPHQGREGEPRHDTSETSTPDSGYSSLPTLPKATPPATEAPKVSDRAANAPKSFTMKVVNAGEVSHWIYYWDDEHGCWQGEELDRQPEDKKPEDAPKKTDGKPQEAPKASPAQAPR